MEAGKSYTVVSTSRDTGIIAPKMCQVCTQRVRTQAAVPPPARTCIQRLTSNDLDDKHPLQEFTRVPSVFFAGCRSIALAA